MSAKFRFLTEVFTSLKFRFQNLDGNAKVMQTNFDDFRTFFREISSIFRYEVIQSFPKFRRNFSRTKRESRRDSFALFLQSTVMFVPHTPLCFNPTSVPSAQLSAFSLHSLSYVLPFVPHTGSLPSGHSSTRGHSHTVEPPGFVAHTEWCLQRAA